LLTAGLLSTSEQFLPDVHFPLLFLAAVFMPPVVGIPDSASDWMVAV
jgi:hypothetical protein